MDANARTGFQSPALLLLQGWDMSGDRGWPDPVQGQALAPQVPKPPHFVLACCSALQYLYETASQTPQ